jgi:hypothetical protein
MPNGLRAGFLPYNTNKETVIIELWLKDAVLSQVERNFSQNKVKILKKLQLKELKIVFRHELFIYQAQAYHW